MRKLGLIVSALSVFIVAALMSPIGVVSAGSTGSPAVPGPHTGASSTPIHLPSRPTRVPSTSTTVTPVNCDSTFHFVGSPNGTGNNSLVSTAAVTPNDVWAVGISTSASGIDQTLAAHWDGTSWTKSSTPNPSAFNADFNAVAAIATDDVWAVGSYQIDSNVDIGIFAEHWNGTSWNLVTTSNPSLLSILFAVTAVDTNHVWAVGTYYNYSFSQFLPLIERWDGTSWTQQSGVTLTSTGFEHELFAVSAWSSTDLWAVGEQTAALGAPRQSLAQHWDGATWTEVTTPNVGSGADNEILGVTALEAGHAVGIGYGNLVNGSTPRQGEAWDLLSNGTSTSTHETGPGAGDNALLGIARSGASVWAVGYSRSTVSGPRQALVIPATWGSAGHSLTWVPFGTSPSPGLTDNALFAVSAPSPYAFWATGYDTNGASLSQTLTEAYCAMHFSMSVPASTLTSTPFSLTVTAQNGDGTTAAGYGGTVHFTTSDLNATLPADYTFTSGDAGTHAFGGVVLGTCGRQTITASDEVMPITMPGSATSTVCVGAYPGPAGTPGSRDTNPGPAPGTPGSRGATSGSGFGPPGPRLPRLEPSAQSGSRPTVAYVLNSDTSRGANGLGASRGGSARDHRLYCLRSG